MFFRTCMLAHIILYCWGEQKARGWFLQFPGWAVGGTVRPPSDKSRRWSGFRVGEETASVWTHRIWTVGYRHIVQMGSWRLWRDLDLLARRGQVIGEHLPGEEMSWGGEREGLGGTGLDGFHGTQAQWLRTELPHQTESSLKLVPKASSGLRPGEGGAGP